MKKLVKRKSASLKTLSKKEIATIKGGMNKSQLIDTIN